MPLPDHAVAHIRETYPDAEIAYRFLKHENVEQATVRFSAAVPLVQASGLAGYVCRYAGWHLTSVNWTRDYRQEETPLVVGSFTLISLVPPSVVTKPGR